MKKIGIMTFQCANNYGAILQAYALQSFLKEKYDCEIINYINKKMKNGYRVIILCKNPLRLIRRVLLSFLHFKTTVDTYKRNKNFRKFSKLYLITSKPYNSNGLMKINREYDAFISGSDQVWNLQLANGWEYFLEFADNSKKYSYAASFGGRIDDKDKDRVAKNLSSFNSLLIREQDGIGIIDTLGISNEPKLVCDPTFFFNRESWIKKLDLQSKNKDYIFVYVVSQETHALEFAKEIAKKENLRIIVNQLYKRQNAYINGTESGMQAGPKEFLELILNAKYMITTSFHGLAFSLIFNTDVFYELNQNENNANSRLETLAEVVSIKDREIGTSDLRIGRMDWDRINDIVGKYSNNSKSLLIDALKDI